MYKINLIFLNFLIFFKFSRFEVYLAFTPSTLSNLKFASKQVKLLAFNDAYMCVNTFTPHHGAFTPIFVLIITSCVHASINDTIEYIWISFITSQVLEKWANEMMMVLKHNMVWIAKERKRRVKFFRSNYGICRSHLTCVINIAWN